MSDKHLQHFHTQYEYVVRIPIWDNFLLPFHPHGSAQHHILINTNKRLYVGCNQTLAPDNRTTVVNHTSDTTAAASFQHTSHPPLPQQVGIYYTFTSPYLKALVNAGILLLCTIRDGLVPLDLIANPAALLLLKNNKTINQLSIHYPFLLTALYGANQIISLTTYQGHIRINPLPSFGFFRAFSLFSSMHSSPTHSPQLQRPQLTTHQDHTYNIIAHLLQHDNFQDIEAILRDLQVRYQFTRGTPAHNDTKDPTLPLSLTTHYSHNCLLPKNNVLSYKQTHQRDYQIHSSIPLTAPLVSQATPQGYCSKYTPKILAQKYSGKDKQHTWSEYNSTVPMPGIVLDTLAGKIRIQGKSFTSKDLPSQKGLIEILMILLQKGSLVHNKELPASSYSKNRNTFESKIALPFNKLLKSMGYSSIAIRSQGSLYDFTTSLLNEGSEITVITKPRNYAPSTSLIK